jgi:hypothetical protein
MNLYQTFYKPFSFNANIQNFQNINKVGVKFFESAIRGRKRVFLQHYLLCDKIRHSKKSKPMNQKELLRTDVHTSFLKQCETYLKKYFGISFGYFEQEIRQLESYMTCEAKIGESPTLIVLETDEKIPFYHHIPDNEFHKLFEIIKEEDANDVFLIYTLWFVAYVVMEQDDSWEYELQDVIDYYDYEIIKEDLLKLYIFKETHNPQTKKGKKIIIKHSKGNISIDNYNNWFAKNLLKDYLNKYLADITDIDQAKKELAKYKRSAGRKVKDPRLHIILYGIYRMFNENKKMKSPKSDALCDFISSYLKFIGLSENEILMDKYWIRAQIGYLEKKPSPPLFPHKGVSERISIEELKNSGKRLY